ncbi:transcriptional regulator [Marinibactrum halimedae]|uniref:Transcriptional regulator n=2 Tax=Marinibactrum halimedae TaxID=1444977 RepID=A0AA37WKK8_9GAMM|nr:transcriptional regulator [Marinibactrum halimedae]
MLKTLHKLLLNLGISDVVCIDNARDALKHIASRRQRTDIVISDLNMPEMDGIELIRHLNSLGTNLSLILVSGEDPRLLDTVQHLSNQDTLKVLSTLSKPVKKDRLIDAIEAYEPPEDLTPVGPAAMVFADELQKAITAGEISVHYQPQVRVSDRRIFGVEALARWKHPTKGNIPPSIFIGIAEKYAMIDLLTDCVFDQALSQVIEWRNLGYDLHLSVNFSATLLDQLDLPERIHTRLEEMGFPRSRFTVEVTESTVANDARTALEILSRLRLKNIGLSIDDFGTGFSSMEQLQNIPFTELKIDRSFVHNSHCNSASQAILESSINLAKGLSIRSVAEGVEIDEDWNLLDKLGCDLVQGFHIAKPLPPETFLQWVKDYAHKNMLPL